MHSISLADRIRQAYLESGAQTSAETLPPEEGELAGLRPAELVSRVRDPEVSLRERDRVMAATIRRYRAGGPSPLWAAVLLEMLGPQLVEEVSLLDLDDPIASDEVLGQQLLLEALSSALVLPLRPNARFVDRRVVRRATWQLVRWLEREVKRSSRWAVFDSDQSERVALEKAAYESWRTKERLSSYIVNRKRRRGSR